MGDATPRPNVGLKGFQMDLFCVVYPSISRTSHQRFINAKCRIALAVAGPFHFTNKSNDRNKGRVEVRLIRDRGDRTDPSSFKALSIQRFQDLGKVAWHHGLSKLKTSLQCFCKNGGIGFWQKDCEIVHIFGTRV